MKRYVPGPHAASPSTNANETPWTDDALTALPPVPRPALRTRVLSKAAEESFESVCVCDRVDVNVAVCERLCDWLGVRVRLGLCVSDGVALPVRLRDCAAEGVALPVPLGVPAPDADPVWEAVGAPLGDTLWLRVSDCEQVWE